MFDENNKQQQDVLYFVPPKPVRDFNYLCDKKFRTELIEDLYQEHEDYGVLYLAGCEFTFYVLNGKDLYELTKTTRKRLPRTHRRGGQSQNRIARLRDEAIHNYIIKINEECLDLFIDTQTTLPKIKGFVIIGSGNKKTKLSDKLDPRLKAILLGVFTSDDIDYDIAYGAVNTFIQGKDNAIVKDVLESGEKLEYGKKQILEALECGYLEKIIITSDMEKELETENYNITEKCEEMSCKYHVISITDVINMGGILGKRWW
jgi:peptide chain release factor subunit 1